jgi:hypothetical protein
MRSTGKNWQGFGFHTVSAIGLLATVLLVGAWYGSVTARAQQGSSANRPPAETTTIEPPLPTNTDNPMKEQMQIAAVGERHKRLVADSDKLLQLATELKAEVDKSTKNEMSVTAVKKAAEIEKLAHDVKERMKGD